LVFRVLLHPAAAKALKKLDEINRKRLKQALLDVAVDPWKVGKPLHPSYFWSTKTGDYRAIYEIDEENNQVMVQFVGHRRNVYDDLTKLQ
jgi:mRNA-degrading endonuclease RelE of RelBE toxin-antitoxin system